MNKAKESVMPKVRFLKLIYIILFAFLADAKKKEKFTAKKQ